MKELSHKVINLFSPREKLTKIVIQIYVFYYTKKWLSMGQLQGQVDIWLHLLLKVNLMTSLKSRDV